MRSSTASAHNDLDRWFAADGRLRDRLNEFALSEEFASLVGWITPDSAVVFTPTLGHRDALPERWRERYAELLQNAERAMEEQLAYEAEDDPGGHPAFHRFDPDGDASDELLGELVQEGYMRFGLWRQDGSSRLELTGTQAVVARHDEIIRTIVAEGLVEQAFLEDISTYNHRRRRLKDYA